MGNLREELENIFKGHFQIICLGNEDRGDDGIGIYIGRKLGNGVILAMNTPVNFLGKIVREDPHVLVIIDGIDAGLASGDIVVADERIVKDSGSQTTHYQDLSDLIHFLNLSGIDPVLRIIGIQVKTTELYGDMSPEIVKSGETLIEIIQGIIRGGNEVP